jgi:hypothetical protein
MGPSLFGAARAVGVVATVECLANWSRVGELVEGARPEIIKSRTSILWVVLPPRIAM